MRLLAVLVGSAVIAGLFAAAFRATASTGSTAWFSGDGTTADTSGSWPALIWDGAAQFDAGTTGGAFRFDGSNGLRGSAPELGNLPTGPFTVHFDVRTSQVPAAGTLMDLASKRGAASDYWQAVLMPDGSIQFEVSTAGPLVVLTSQPGLNDGSWHSVTLERGTELCLVVDGSPAGACASVANAAVDAGSAVFEVANGHPAIGAGVAPFVGLLDNMYVGAAALVDLAVVPSAAPAVAAGSGGTVQLVLDNPAAGTTAAALRVTPPAGVSFTSIDPALPGCAITPDGAISCGDATSFPAGQFAMSLGFSVDPAAPPGTVSARVSWTSSAGPDLDPADNTDVGLPMTILAAPAPSTTTTTAATTLPPPVPTEPAQTPPPVVPPAAPPPAPPEAATAPPPAPTSPPPIASSPPPVPEPTATAPPTTPPQTAPTPPTPAITAATTPPTSSAPEPTSRGRAVDEGAERTGLRLVDGSGGRRSGPPGVGIAVEGDGYGGCKRAYVFFDGNRIGSDSPDADGVIRLHGISVPGDTKPGTYTITSSCHSSGTPVLHSTSFEVTDERWHRSGWLTSLPRLHQVDWDADSMKDSGIATALILVLVAFPSQLFNKTLDENYDEIRGWFRWARSPSELAALWRWIVSIAFFVGAAVLNSLIDPSFRFGVTSLPALTGRFLSSVVILVVFSVPSIVYMNLRYGELGKLKVRPGTLAIAGTFVLASRLLRLKPGYIYGLLAGIKFRNRVAPSTRGRLAALKLAFLLAVGLISWAAWSAVAGLNSGDHPSVGLLVVESVLGSMFAAALLTPVFSLLPLHLLDGKEVMSWSRVIWITQFAVSTFLLIHILLRPSSDYVSKSRVSSMTAAVLAFVAFAALSVAFWAYFNFRSKAPA